MDCRSAGAVALVLLTGAGPATADFSVSYTDGRIRVVDNDTGRTVISDDPLTRHRVYTPAQSGGDIEPTITWSPAGASAEHAEGLDLTFTFDNTAGASPRRPGPIYIPGITFGLASDQVGRVRTRDFHVTGQAQDITTSPLDTGWNTDQEAQYPGHLFAPVSYLHAGEYALGVSLQYPLIDPFAGAGSETPNQYAHRVAFGNHLFPPQAGERRTWEVAVTLAARDFANADAAAMEGLVPAGESRTYTLSLRVMRTAPPAGGAWSADPGAPLPENAWDAATAPQPWLRLFEPYRAYFAARYAGVRYTADPRPIRGCTTAQASLVSATNPYGFVEFPGGGGRPWPEGWSHWRDELLYQSSIGWSRFMVWTPTGLYPGTPVDYNFPFQFTSQWAAMPGSQPELLAQVNDGHGRELGLWWGNSTHVMTAWPQLTPPVILDPENPAHAALALREVDGAVNTAQARMVGLDAFGSLPVWQAYHWMRRLQSWYPSVRFVIEPMPCDIMATLAPGYMLATRPSWASVYRVVTPHYLAQLLVPGHEVWGAVEKNHLLNELGRWPTENEIIARCRTVSQLGFAPIVFADASILGEDLSAKTPRVLPIPTACTADFNNDGDVATDQDIEAFFACLGGNCCPRCASADFNADGDVATDQDIESFFRVMGGGSC